LLPSSLSQPDTNELKRYTQHLKGGREKREKHKNHIIKPIFQPSQASQLNIKRYSNNN